MRKHTPGPWRLRRAEHILEHDFILHAGPHIIAWSVPRADRRNTRKKSEHIANAKLIAAAPALLEALKLMRHWAEADQVNYTGDHPVAVACAAIAKAEAK